MAKTYQVSEIEKRALIERALHHLGVLKRQKVLVVGDIGLDEYVNGSVVRISPEAPVPVVEVTNESQRLGLAANVAQNIVSLGGHATLLSVLGDDSSGRELRALLQDAGVGADHLQVSSDRPTTTKLRVMSGQHHLVRVDFEKRRALPPEMELRLLSVARELIDGVDILILEDYAKGVLSASLIEALVTAAHSKGKKVLADPHRQTPVTHYHGIDLLTPNQEEACQLVGLEVDFLSTDLDQLPFLGAELLKKTGSEQLIITLGKRGLALFEGDRVALLPTFAQEVYDVTGAGDTFIAALGLGWSSGLSLLEAGVFANFAAGYVVGKVGCVACPLAEVESYMQKSLES